MTALVTVFACALALGMVLTAAMKNLAPRLGLTDRPDGRRKLHRAPMPLGGGAAVFLATALVLLGVGISPHPWGAALRGSAGEFAALLAACTLIVALGLLDDRVQLRGRQKLLGQFAAIGVLMLGGPPIQRVALFGHPIELGLLAYPVTCFWLLGAINSINLLDGIDGLATMLGIILTATFAILAAMIGQTEVAVIALAFTGSLCGFLRYNFPPASIFLGDAGSMLIGLVVGSLAMHGSLKGPGTVLLAAPLAVLTLPILDSSAAILRRRLSGRSIYSTDRGHLHHRLLERLGSHQRVLGLVGVCCLTTSAAALVAVWKNRDTIALLVGAAMVVMLIATGIFGRSEFSLLWKHLLAVGRSMLFAGYRNQQTATIHEVQLQGTRQWDALWSGLVESADRLQLRKIHLDLDLPMLHESYQATWVSPLAEDRERLWRIDLPLLVTGHAVGRLSVIGHRHEESAVPGLESLAEVVDCVETELRAAIEDCLGPPSHPEQPALVGQAAGREA